MQRIQRIAGIGGAAIAGGILAIGLAAPSPSEHVVFFSILCSALLGGLMPIVGLYAGAFGCFGLVVGATIGEGGWVVWPTAVFIGVAFGGVHLVVRLRRGPTDGEDEGDAKCSEGALGDKRVSQTVTARQHMNRAIVLATAGLAVGAGVGLVLGAPGGPGSVFSITCVLLGVLLGVTFALAYLLSVASARWVAVRRKRLAPKRTSRGMPDGA